MDEQKFSKPNKSTQSDNLTIWKNFINGVFKDASDEIIKATSIGKHMIKASKSNSKLKECYEKLGRLALSQIKNGQLKWEDSEVETLAMQIEKLEMILDELEKNVQEIKKRFPS